VLFDRDSKFGSEVLQFLRSSALKPMRTSIRSPWQNGVAERWVGSVRRELLDHITLIIFAGLGATTCLLHQDRTHIGLNKNTPDERAVGTRSRFQTRIVSTSRLGGLHHRYRWSEAA
jgi:putative transposase